MKRNATYTLMLGFGLSLSLGCGEEGGEVGEPVRWYLTFSDEFEAPAMAPPDPTYWTAEIGAGGWGNQELQFYTNRVENVRHDGEGNLEIIGRNEEYGGAQYTSARLITLDKFEQQYGRFEARIKLPPGAGLWPAFWMLGNDFEEVGWPQTGEIDIMEFVGRQPHETSGALHGPGYSGGQSLYNFRDLGEDATADFRVFAVDWDPGRIVWWVDGQEFMTIDASAIADKGEWVYDHPFFMLLNLAIGGTLGGAVAPSTPFPAVMKIDYVRVFSREPPPGS